MKNELFTRVQLNDCGAFAVPPCSPTCRERNPEIRNYRIWIQRERFCASAYGDNLQEALANLNTKAQLTQHEIDDLTRAFGQLLDKIEKGKKKGHP